MCVCVEMRSTLQVLVLVLVLLSLVPPTSSFSRGATRASCQEMVPGHIRAQPLDPRLSHVTLRSSASSYLPGQLVTGRRKHLKTFTRIPAWFGTMSLTDVWLDLNLKSQTHNHSCSQLQSGVLGTSWVSSSRLAVWIPPGPGLDQEPVRNRALWWWEGPGR